MLSGIFLAHTVFVRTDSVQGIRDEQVVCVLINLRVCLGIALQGKRPRAPQPPRAQDSAPTLPATPDAAGEGGAAGPARKRTRRASCADGASTSKAPKAKAAPKARPGVVDLKPKPKVYPGRDNFVRNNLRGGRGGARKFIGNPGGLSNRKRKGGFNARFDCALVSCPCCQRPRGRHCAPLQFSSLSLQMLTVIVVQLVPCMHVSTCMGCALTDHVSLDSLHMQSDELHYRLAGLCNIVRQSTLNTRSALVCGCRIEDRKRRPQTRYERVKAQKNVTDITALVVSAWYS